MAFSSGAAGRSQSTSATLSKFAALTGVKDFVAGLTRAEKSYSEIKSMTECAFGVKSLHKSFTFCFIIKFKAGKSAEEEYNFNLRGLWILLPLSPPPC